MSQPPEYPGEPADPYGGSQNPPSYPPPPSYAPPGRHSAPPPGYRPPPPPPGPPPGGYPPQPGYGAPPPPPPPPPGYGPPPGGYSQPGYGNQPVGSKFNVGEAVSWSWAKFTQNGTALVVPVIGYLVAVGVIVGVVIALASGLATTSTTTSTDAVTGITSEQTNVEVGAGGVIAIAIGYLLLFVVLIYMTAGIVSGTLDIADGKPVTIATFFKPRNLVGVVITALLVALTTTVLSLLCIIPGIIFGFLAQFAVHFVVDRSQSPVAAVKSSIATTRSDVGGSLLSWLVQFAAVLIGEALCLIGLFVAFPVASLLQTYTYRKLSGGVIVPLDQPGYPQGPPVSTPPGPLPA